MIDWTSGRSSGSASRPADVVRRTVTLQRVVERRAIVHSATAIDGRPIREVLRALGLTATQEYGFSANTSRQALGSNGNLRVLASTWIDPG